MTFEEKLDALTQRLEAEVILEAEARKRQDQRMAELQAGQEKTERTLRWAIRLAVREARNERRRRQELDTRLTQRLEDLANYADHRHQQLEALLTKFLERGGNGQH
ncbi:MAG TPA: hypothetical protein VME43_03755 [Bryobacteraceae bacterium]|nr:hypothetical protein [Bryobacteraceae bacterium]